MKLSWHQNKLTTILALVVLALAIVAACLLIKYKEDHQTLTTTVEVTPPDGFNMVTVVQLSWVDSKGATQSAWIGNKANSKLSIRIPGTMRNKNIDITVKAQIVSNSTFRFYTVSKDVKIKIKKNTNTIVALDKIDQSKEGGFQVSLYSDNNGTLTKLTPVKDGSYSVNVGEIISPKIDIVEDATTKCTVGTLLSDPAKISSAVNGGQYKFDKAGNIQLNFSCTDVFDINRMNIYPPRTISINAK